MAAEERPVVLLVEDELHIARLVRFTLERAHFNVKHARTGGEAIQIASGARVDLVLMDMVLPDLDGERVLEALQADPRTRGIPVIVMSARDRPPQAVASSVIVGYVAKPFELGDLVGRLREVLGPRPQAEVPLPVERQG